MPRLFTREEAEQVLPKIVPMLEDLRTLKTEHDSWEKKLEALQTQTKTNGHGVDVDVARAQQGKAQAVVAINTMVERVKELGAEVKDIEMGLIDFRARIQGREAYLCWKLGEDRIDWWHELNTGYGSRQPL